MATLAPTVSRPRREITTALTLALIILATVPLLTRRAQASSGADPGTLVLASDGRGVATASQVAYAAEGDLAETSVKRMLVPVYGTHHRVTRYSLRVVEGQSIYGCTFNSGGWAIERCTTVAKNAGSSLWIAVVAICLVGGAPMAFVVRRNLRDRPQYRY